jgi:acyl carrier protein
MVSRQEIEQDIIRIVSSYAVIDAGLITDTASLAGDLELSETEIADIIYEIENKYEVALPGDFEDYEYVTELIDAVCVQKGV